MAHLEFSENLPRDEEGYIYNPHGGAIYGYIRVSTQRQADARQWDAMEAYGVRRSSIFAEKVSGKNFNRPQYKKMIRVLRRGDIVVINSLDRLGRNYQDVQDQWRMITQDIGCGIRVIDMPMLNVSSDPNDLISKFITDLMLQVLSFVAQNEREDMLKRQKAGWDAIMRARSEAELNDTAALKAGEPPKKKMKLGRPKQKFPFEFWEYYIRWKKKEAPSKTLLAEANEHFAMSGRTFYRRMMELDRRYGDIPVDRLKDLIIDQEIIDEGFEYSTERCLKATGQFDAYMESPKAYNRSKTKEYRAKKREIMEVEDFKEIILEKRREEYQRQFERSTLPSMRKPVPLKDMRRGDKETVIEMLRDLQNPEPPSKRVTID